MFGYGAALRSNSELKASHIRRLFASWFGPGRFLHYLFAFANNTAVSS